MKLKKLVKNIQPGGERVQGRLAIAYVKQKKAKQNIKTTVQRRQHHLIWL